MAITDQLTGLHNRRYMARHLSTLMKNAGPTKPISFLVMDIDHFKSVNDTYGHDGGDEVLKEFASRVGANVRGIDLACRYGGEEFAVILPSCDIAFGKIVADRIRETIESLRIPLVSRAELQVTVSIGGAFAPEWIRSTTAIWTDRADLQLYRAKSEGRNRVCIDAQQKISVSAEEKSLLFGHLSLGDTAWIDSVANDAPSQSPRAAQ